MQPATVDVSFAVASFNCRDYLEAAVASALAQRDVTLEVLIVDDGSSDGSRELAERLAQQDSRVRVLATAENGGPGRARNVAIDAMRGRWYAVLDSDDLIGPERSAVLIAAADRNAADMVADDLTVFGDGLVETRFLGTAEPVGRWIELERYFSDSKLFGPTPDPGFLKPMVRRELLERTGITYDDRLRIAEDDNLVVRLLLAGARYWLEPLPMYRYRKHAASISHRLSLDHAERMMAAADRLRDSGVDSPAFRRRNAALADGVAFTRAIDALKARRPFAALAAVARRPRSLALFAMPIRARLKRLKGG